MAYKPMFRSLADYYAANPQRRSSQEADYGVHWRLAPWPHRRRVSYLRATGEVYAVHQGGSCPDNEGPVLLLGLVEPDPVPAGAGYCATLDHILEGWPIACGKPEGLQWVKERLAAASQGK